MNALASVVVNSNDGTCSFYNFICKNTHRTFSSRTLYLKLINLQKKTLITSNVKNCLISIDRICNMHASCKMKCNNDAVFN